MYPCPPQLASCGLLHVHVYTPMTYTGINITCWFFRKGEIRHIPVL